MKLLTYYTGLILSILVFQFSFSQTTIEGKVTDQNNQPLFEQILLFRILILEQLLMKRVIWNTVLFQVIQSSLFYYIE
jgi:hypothetical protein